MRWQLRLSKRILELVSLIYIYISLLIFLWGWCRPLITLVSTVVIIYAVYSVDKENRKSDEFIVIDIRALIFTVFFLLVIGYYAGYGRFTLQASDWMKHNAVIYDLVNKSWPVYYHNGSENSMLTYYIGQYLLPALCGKMVHSARFAEKVNFLWCVLGLLLADLNVLKVLRIKKVKVQVLTPVLMSFFASPLALEYIVCQAAGYSDAVKFQYAGNFTLIRWAFPQAIVMWITVTLWIAHRDKIEHYAAILLPSMLYGILSFLGIIPLALVMAIYTIVKEKDIKVSLKSLFSISNILMTATVGFVLLAYYYGNVTGEKPDEIGFHLIDFSFLNLKQYFISMICMVGIYAACLWKKNQKNIFFISALAELIILPLFVMGANNDLVSRASIPALFIFFMLTLSSFNDLFEEKSELKKNTWQTCLLVITLTYGLVDPLHQLGVVIAYDNILYVDSPLEWTTLEDFANREDPSVQNDLKYNYYSYDIEDNFFYKHLSRKQMD